MSRHPGVNQLLRWFAFDHLPAGLPRRVSAEFHDLAYRLVDHHELAGPELTTGLRKLLEAKDCAVRAVVGGDK